MTIPLLSSQSMLRPAFFHLPTVSSAFITTKVLTDLVQGHQTPLALLPPHWPLPVTLLLFPPLPDLPIAPAPGLAGPTSSSPFTPTSGGNLIQSGGLKYHVHVGYHHLQPGSLEECLQLPRDSVPSLSNQDNVSQFVCLFVLMFKTKYNDACKTQ